MESGKRKMENEELKRKLSFCALLFALSIFRFPLSIFLKFFDADFGDCFVKKFLVNPTFFRRRSR